jgi:hypothetical protein
MEPTGGHVAAETYIPLLLISRVDPTPRRDRFARALQEKRTGRLRGTRRPWRRSGLFMVVRRLQDAAQFEPRATMYLSLLCYKMPKDRKSVV